MSVLAAERWHTVFTADQNSSPCAVTRLNHFDGLALPLGFGSDHHAFNSISCHIHRERIFGRLPARYSQNTFVRQVK